MMIGMIMMLGEVIFDVNRITVEDTTLAFVGYLIVFVALIALYFVFNYMPSLLKVITKRKLRSKGMKEEEIVDDLTITGEVSAAISASIFLFYNEMHDDEKTVLTIKKISKSYSPWSSKIYNVTKGLNRRF